MRHIGEAYRNWIDANHRRYVIPLPEKQNMDSNDSDSSSESDTEE